MKRNTHYGLIVRTISVFLLVFILSLPLGSCIAGKNPTTESSATELPEEYLSFLAQYTQDMFISEKISISAIFIYT